MTGLILLFGLGLTGEAFEVPKTQLKPQPVFEVQSEVKPVVYVYTAPWCVWCPGAVQQLKASGRFRIIESTTPTISIPTLPYLHWNDSNGNGHSMPWSSVNDLIVAQQWCEDNLKPRRATVAPLTPPLAITTVQQPVIYQHRTFRRRFR